MTCDKSYNNGRTYLPAPRFINRRFAVEQTGVNHDEADYLVTSFESPTMGPEVPPEHQILEHGTPAFPIWKLATNSRMQHNNFRGSAECFRGLKKRLCGSYEDFRRVVNVCGSIINVCGTTINVRALRKMFCGTKINVLRTKISILARKSIVGKSGQSFGATEKVSGIFPHLDRHINGQFQG